MRPCPCRLVLSGGRELGEKAEAQERNGAGFLSLRDLGCLGARPSQPVTLRACKLVLLVSPLLSTHLEFLFDFCPWNLQQRL